MQKKTVLATLILLLSISRLFAESDSERQLAALITQRDKAISDATEPINRRYKVALEQLLRHATQSNDLTAALKIQAELNAGQPKTPGARFHGKWVSKALSSRLEFTAAGDFSEEWNNTVQHGRWAAISETELTVTLMNGSTDNYELIEGGRSVRRGSGIWNREK